jgi:hypothetical protein
MTQMTKLYVDALVQKYEAQKSEALANLNLYFSSNNLAAIGEHSDLLAEHDRWVDQYATANDKLEALCEITKKLEISTKKTK